MTDTKGNIRARKLGNTGITEDILTKIANAKGGHIVAIVELRADTIHEQVDGDDRTVDFLIDTIEAVVDGRLDGALVDHVRDIQRALHRNRMLAQNGPQLPIDGDDADEPTVEGVLAARDALIETDEKGPKLWDGESMPPDDDGPHNEAETVPGTSAGDQPDGDPWEYPEPEGAGATVRT